MLGLSIKYEEYQDLAFDKESTQKAKIINFKTDKKLNQKDIDSLTEVSKKEVDKQLKSFGLDSITSEEIKKGIDKGTKKPDVSVMNFEGGTTRLTKMYRFYKDNKKTPVTKALDSLQLTNSFWNRFLYRKMGVVNDFAEDSEKANQEFSKELISYASISIFLFLPLFTLFLAFFYIRRKFTYVEHLIFVFHTQTMFFILLSILLIVNFWVAKENIYGLFGILFSIYLFLAMKNFYRQGWFKTLVKLFFIAQIYIFMASIGFFFVALIAFAMY